MKYQRQAKILELVEKYDIETQDDLLEKLKEEGFQATQATVSRDIREMNLTKVSVFLGVTYVKLQPLHQAPDDDRAGL